jgi:hypothetical protein
MENLGHCGSKQIISFLGSLDRPADFHSLSAKASGDRNNVEVNFSPLIHEIRKNIASFDGPSVP